MNRIVMFLISQVFCLQILSGQSEADYAKVIQSEIGGVLEYELADGSRVDLLTRSHAYEIDRAFKWTESIGQSLWYALQSNRKAGIILIRETKADFKYVQQLISTLDHTGLSKSIKVLVYPDDFRAGVSLMSKKRSKKTAHWLSRNSNKRHNDRCHNYENTNGYYCGPFEGKAAGCCGG